MSGFMRVRRVSPAILLAFGLLPSVAAAQHAADPSGDPSDTDRFRVDVGGYGSFRYEANFADVPSSITLRRFIVTTDAHVGSRLQVYSEVEYERLSEIEVERSAERESGGLKFEQELEGTDGSEIAIEQAWARFAFSDAFGVRFGAVLPPVGRFNLQHDDNLWNFPRRPLIDRGADILPVASAWTEMGLGFTGEFFAGEDLQIAYEAYVLNGVEMDFVIEDVVQTREPASDKLELEVAIRPTAGAFNGSNTADAFAGRVRLSPALGSEFALSAYTGRYAPSYLDSDGRITTLGIDGRQKVGPLYLEGELLHTSYSNVDGFLRDFASAARDAASETTSEEAAGLETEIAIDVSGLSDSRYGFWLDAGWPIPLRSGLLGLEAPMVIPVARYERAWYSDDLEAFDFAAGTVTSADRADRAQERLSLGVAFRPLAQAVVHLTYERNRAVEGELIDPEISEESTDALTLGVAFGF